jgi:hypothetical protein
MKQNLYCRFGNIHKYEVYKEIEVKDPKGNVIGINIVSRCTNCGKITNKVVYTEEPYGKY